jgi:uncharacterized membrane protein YjgN (DUF898 family)
MSDKDSVSLEFKGSGSEFFQIWIVNLILSILTLGIYSAWAKVRTKRYLYGNTSIEGASFEYHADPITILKGRLIAFAALIVYSVITQIYPISNIVFLSVFALIVPWIIWRSTIFNAKMTSIRNVRFGFKGPLKGAYLYYLVVPVLLPLLLTALISFAVLLPFQMQIYAALLIVATIGYISIILLFPYAHKLQMVYFINNFCYGQGRFVTKILASKFYLIDVVAFFITAALTLLALVPIIVITIVAGGLAVTEQEGVLVNQYVDILIGTSLFLGLLVYVLLLSSVLLGKAYLTAQLRNYVYANTKLDDSIGLSSNLNTWHLFWIYLSNFFLLVFTLGFAYSWTVIRTTRYMVETVSVNNTEALSQFVSEQQQQQSALGEEMVEAFNIDAGIDF